MSRKPPEMLTTPPDVTTGSAVPVTQQIQWAERDLAMRRAAYPTMVEKGQIETERASMDLTVLTCVVASLRVFQLQSTSKAKLPKGAKKPPDGAKPVVIYFDTEAARKEFIAMLANLGVKDVEAP